MKSVFDIDSGDVVGEQNNFVGVEFVLIFAQKVALANQIGLNKASDESTGAREGFKDVNIFIRERAVEIFLKDGVDGADNKIDDFNGGIDNAEPLDGFRDGHAEKFIVKLDDNFLLIFSGGSDLATFAHGVIKLFELRGVVVGIFDIELRENFFKGLRDGVIFGEGVIIKESLEDRSRDDMLSEHFNRVIVGDGGI